MSDNDTSLREPEVPLVALLVQKSYDNYASTTQQLMENYRREIDTLKATVHLIRARMEDALDAPYAPSTRHLSTILYPYGEDVEAVAEGFRKERQEHEARYLQSGSTTARAQS